MKGKVKIVAGACIIMVIFASMTFAEGIHVSEETAMKESSGIGCEQFIIEIRALNERKEFLISPWNMFNLLIELKVERMRKDYNAAYIEIFKKYGLFTDEVFEELDEIWKDTHKKFRINPWILMLHIPYMTVKGRWEYYKERTLELAKEKCIIKSG